MKSSALTPWLSIGTGVLIATSSLVANEPGHQALVLSSTSDVDPNALGPSSLGSDGTVVFQDWIGSGYWRANGAAANELVKGGNAAPGGGVFSDYGFSSGYFAVNRPGDLAFVADSKIGTVTNEGLFFRRGGILYRLAYGGQAAPGGGVFGDFHYGFTGYGPCVSDTGWVVFWAETTGGPGSGIYTARIEGGVSVVRKVALLSDAAPDGGYFTDLLPDFQPSWAILNDGRVCFQAVTSANYKTRLYFWDGNGLAVVPGSDDVRKFMINQAGEIAFSRSEYNGPLLVRGTPSGTVTILRYGDVLPGGGTVNSVDHPAINESGQVAFLASQFGGPASQGVFRWDGGGVKVMAHHAGPAPGGGNFKSSIFERLVLTNPGNVYWLAPTTGGAAIFMGDGNVVRRVIGPGAQLAGNVVTSIAFNDSIVYLRSGNGPADDAGRVVYRAALQNNSDSGIFLFTPPTGWAASPEREITVQEPDLVEVPDGGTRSFGTVVTGSSANLTFQIKNTGLTQLTGIAATIDGTNPADFAVVTPAATSLSGPSGVTALTVRFQPLGTGARTATLRIASNDADENPYDIVLIGTGTAPEISVEQPDTVVLSSGASTIDFGTATAGTSGAVKTFRIRNSGQANLTLSGVTKLGGTASAFSVNTSSMATTVAPGGSTTFSVSFTPSATGPASTGLRIANNDLDENPFAIALTGNAIAPEIDLEQPPGTSLVAGASVVPFASTVVGSQTSLSFTIWNRGTASLTIGSVSQASGHGDFAPDLTGMSSVIAPGGQTGFTVRFSPTTAGARSATLRILSDDGNENPFDVLLTGTGLAPEIAVESPTGSALLDGASLSFGTAEAGLPGAVRVCTIRNTGSATLHLSGVQNTGGNPGEFVIDVSGMAPAVAPGSATSFSVTFLPAGVGMRSTFLRIASNDGDENPFDLILSGMGTRPEISVEHPAGTDLQDGIASIQFAPVGTGATGAAKTVVIRNVGETNLTLTGVVATGADAKSFPIRTTGMTPALPPGGTTTFQVALAPETEGPKTAVLSILSDDVTENPFEITLSGNGVLNNLPLITLAGDNPLNFEAGASYTDPGASASDAEDGSLVPVITANSVQSSAPGGYQVTWSVTDGYSGTATATRTVRVVDTTAPRLTVPSDLEVTATSGAGAVVNYPAAVASDQVGVTSLIYSKPSGSLFPGGTTLVTVTAADAAGNSRQGTFQVTVNPGGLDRLAPVLRLRIPSPSTTTVGATFAVSGTVSENFALASFEVRLNQVPLVLDQPLSFVPGVPAAWSVNGLVAENGPNLIEVEAVDLTGRKGRITKSVIYTNNRPGLSGHYSAWIEPVEAPGVDTCGLVTVNPTSRGTFSGRILLGGTSHAFSGYLRNDGTARFQRGLTDSLELRAGARGQVRSLGFLRFAISESKRLSGTLTKDGAESARFEAAVAPYGRAFPVAAERTGDFNLVHGSKGQTPERLVTSYPQGDGISTLRLTAHGVASWTGYLADGTKFSTSARLREDGTLAFFIPLYRNLGGWGGQVAFADAADSDLSGTDLLWLRPAQPSAPQYPAGWPGGIRLDAVGTAYRWRTAVNFGQAEVDPLQGNVLLTLTSPPLSSPIEAGANIHGTTGAAAVAGTSRSGARLTFTAKSGAFSGSLRAPSGIWLAYRGVVLNKGSNAGGYGFYLTPGPQGESGAVSIQPRIP